MMQYIIASSMLARWHQCHYVPRFTLSKTYVHSYIVMKMWIFVDTSSTELFALHSCVNKTADFRANNLHGRCVKEQMNMHVLGHEYLCTYCLSVFICVCACVHACVHVYIVMCIDFI